MAAQGYFLKIAELSSRWIFPLTQLAIFGSALAGMRVVTLGISLLVFGVMGLIPGLFVRERFGVVDKSHRRRSEKGIFRATFEVLRNRAFCFLLVITLLKVMAGMFANSFDYYLLVYSVFDGDLVGGSVWKAILTSGAALAGLATIRPIVRLSERTGKRRALVWAYVLLAAGGVAKLWIFLPGHRWLLLLDPLLGGPAWMAMALLLPSMLADVCDQDDLQHGERREGLYGSVLLWFQQVATALMLYFSGSALNYIGFDVALTGAQESGVMPALRWMVAGVTVVVGGVSVAVLCHYPLSRQRSGQISKILAERRAGQ
jgi:GPH family glycoside/pentoside/hexuronide:cation symporter